MNRRHFTTALAGLLLTGASALAQSSSWVIDPNHSQADFQIRHMEVSNVRGSIGGVAGTIVWDPADLTRSSVEATLKTSTVSTTIEKRDIHLKSPDFFNVEKYPTMAFKSTQVKRENGKLEVVGDLTLAGVTKSITLEVDGPTPPQKGMNGKMVIGISATGTLKRSDFNFGQKFTTPVLGDEVRFTIDAEADQ